MSKKNAVTLFDGKTQMPAHLTDAFSSEKSNVTVAESTPSLTVRGAKFRIRKGGEEVLLTRNIDGEKVAVPYIDVVVVAVNPARSRNFFEGSYTEGEVKAPDCFSLDGKEPDPSSTSRQAKTCASCPQAVKGSKITENNKPTTACAAVKRIAVIPVKLLNTEQPLLLKIPQTSIWDKNNPEKDAEGKFAWDQYMKFLNNRGVTHTAMLVTRISFDDTTAYPKLLFSAQRFLEESELAIVKELVDAKETSDMVLGHGLETADAEVAEAAAGETESHKSGTKKKPAPQIEDDDDDDDDDGFDLGDDDDEEEPAKPPKTKPGKKRKPAPQIEDDDGDDDDDGDFDLGDDDVAPPKKSAAKTGTKKKSAPQIEDAEVLEDEDDSSEVPDELADLIDDWDD